jgi:hypothetical protein
MQAHSTSQTIEQTGKRKVSSPSLSSSAGRFVAVFSRIILFSRMGTALPDALAQAMGDGMAGLFWIDFDSFWFGLLILQVDAIGIVDGGGAVSPTRPGPCDGRPDQPQGEYLIENFHACYIF